mmetsp:Transcript_4448/g.4191  ORF Transcript_4448/g.4191 Transcript_4448/m.4191 type:complete len:92 (-) Transcript_4448:216-491(-)
MFLREGGETFKKKLYYPNFQFHNDNIIKVAADSSPKAFHTNLDARVVQYQRPMAQDDPKMSIKSTIKHRNHLYKEKMRRIQPLVLGNIEKI